MFNTRIKTRHDTVTSIIVVLTRKYTSKVINYNHDNILV